VPSDFSITQLTAELQKAGSEFSTAVELTEMPEFVNAQL